jgi:superfamily I DNA/RNA helicase
VNETWWVDPSQLDDAQKEILVEPPETEMLIVGPPGSGKTNILMLRANYVRSVAPRILFLTFTRTLAEFLRSGPNVGRGDQIQQSDIRTFMGWSRQLIKENGGTPPADSEKFSATRVATASCLEQIVTDERIGAIYDVVFIDEVQDFLEVELQLVRRLARHINAAGDSRQRIWDHREGIPTVASMVSKTVSLENHYRIGEKLCEFADQILPPKEGEIPLVDGCNYLEEARPSSVTPVRCGTMADAFGHCLDAIKEQVRYISDEPIGVLCITNDVRDQFWEALQADGELSAVAILQSAGAYQAFGPQTFVRVMTVASAKGSEFRAVHLLGAERYTTNRRELAFTAVTRAKTEVTLYHVNPLPGHMSPPRDELPSLSSIF